jgi:conjugative transfer pilus assembly protein TraH
MKIYYKKVSFLIFGWLCSTLIQADPAASIREFFNRNGGAINITTPGAHNGQRSGHYTLGGVSSRSNTASINPFSIQGLGIRGGCSGIDAQFGAFSHIKSAELKRLLNSIISGGANYAWMIGFETLCPMCKKTMDQLNKLAQDINQWGLNSCNMAATAMGSLLPQTEATSKYLCPHLGVESGIVTDYAAGRQSCGAQGQAPAIYAAARNRRDHVGEIVKEFLIEKGNLAWMILKKRNYFKDGSGEDDALKELMMSLSGSIILQETNEVREFKILKSLASNRTLYDALLFGGAQNTATIYKCDTVEENGCLNPTRTQSLVIPEAQSFTGHVKNLLQSIQTKVLRDEGALTAAEIDLINTTRKIVSLRQNCATYMLCSYWLR